MEREKYQQLSHSTQMELQELMNQVELGEEAVIESNRSVKLFSRFSFKGIVSRDFRPIFDPRFFHQSIPLDSLINGLKYFCIWLRIRKEIREYKIFVVESNRISPRIRSYSICKADLAHESGDSGVPLNEKTEGRKSREAVPLIGAGCEWVKSNSNKTAFRACQGL
jgi:hypothetical protein